MLDIALVGDLVLDEPDADYWLAGIAPALAAADLAIAHLEGEEGGAGVRAVAQRLARWFNARPAQDSVAGAPRDVSALRLSLAPRDGEDPPRP